MAETLLVEPVIAEEESSKRVAHVPAVSQEDSALEVTEFFETLHPFLGRALLYLILVFVVVALIWAGVSEVDIVATAPFQLVPLGHVNRVQAPREGEIEVIGVKEGDRVRKGEVLFKLRSRETWMELREFEQAKVQFQKARYDLFEALPQRRDLVRETIASLEYQLVLMQRFKQTYRKALHAYRKSLDDGIVTHEGEADLQAEIQFRSAELEHLKQQYHQNKALYDRKLISRSALDESRVRYFGALATLPNRMSEIYRQEMTVRDLKRQILEARIELDREEARAKHVCNDAQLRLERAQQAVNRDLEAEWDLILAPESGIITQVHINTVGQVVNKGESLVILAPKSAPLVAEVIILNKDVGLLKPGQVVRLKYDAFAFQDFGIKRGWLKQISPDVVHTEELGPVFRGIVELEETVVWVQGYEKPLMYGMKGIAEVVIDRQSVLMLLLKPLRELHESAAFRANQEG
ncbi:MAG: HlyD family type I secretion periplasmic adaptor subunit [bacterium]|nr:HlyD family type I secretion periplasmic adaptor subunit [bacterium]